MAISESPIGSFPIAAEGGAAPAPPADAFTFPGIRSSRAIPAPPSALRGRVKRAFGFAENESIPRPPGIRSSRAIPMPPDTLKGGAKRFEGFSKDSSIDRAPRFRFSRAIPMPPDTLRGRVNRLGGFSENISVKTLPPAIRRTRQALFPKDLLLGRITRVEAAGPTPFPPLGIRRSAKTIPIPAEMLRIQTRRRDGFSPDIIFKECVMEYAESYRVADSDLDRYELYVGEDALPDLTTEPISVSTTLPFSLPVTLPGSGVLKTLNVVLRKRSKYGLISGNQKREIFVIDSVGAIELAPPDAPVNLQVFPDIIGGAAVLLRYNAAADGANPADTWEVFATEGAAPDPDIATPAHTSTIVSFGGMAYLSAKISPYTPGAVLHVIGAVKRVSDGKRTVTTEALLTLPLAPSISGGETNSFGGDAFVHS